MGVKGRKNFSNTPLVYDVPDLPYPLWKGEITYTDSMFNEPSGAIAYEGISSTELPKLERAYPMGKVVNFYGVPMEVESLSYTQEDVIVLRYGQLVVYSVNISLQFRSIVLQAKERFGLVGNSNRYGLAPSSQERWQEELEDIGDEADRIGFTAYSDGIRPKALGSGKTWEFSQEQIIELSGNAIALPSEGYNKATLTWGDEASQKTNTTEFSPAQPVIDVQVQGKDDLVAPPLDTNQLRDSSSNHDESGPTKFERTITTVDGTPDQEHYELYGFAYQYKDIFNANGGLLGIGPTAFWQLVEERDTQYVYREAGASTLEVDIRDPSTSVGEAGAQLSFAIHPDYDEFIQASGSNRIRIKNSTKYLTEIITRGRKLMRLNQETDERNSLDDQDTYNDLFRFRWVSFYEKKAFLLKPARGVFVPEDEQLPFRVEFADYDTLEPRIQARVGSQGATADGRVAILYPDPNYVEPFYIAQETQQASSYEWAPDPDNEPPAHFHVGEETSNEIKRQVTDVATSRYVEIKSLYSAQDPQFEAVAEQIEFTEQRGTPPSPTIRQARFDPEIVRPRGNIGDDSRTYLITTPDNADRFEEGGSISIPGAENVNEAIEAAKVRLRRSGLKNETAQYKVAWFYPSMKPGDTIRIEGDRHANEGDWLVTQIKWKLKFEATNTPSLGSPMILCEDGMQLELGLDRERQVIVSSKATDDTSAPTVSVSQTGDPFSIGRVLPPLPNRRNF